MSIMQDEGTHSVPRIKPACGRFVAVFGVVAALAIAGSASATVCIVPDDGTGTAALPPVCSTGYLSPTDVHEIIDGLPPGTTIQLDASHNRFFTTASGPGGNLGGEFEIFDSELQLTLIGTGDLTGFVRTLIVPATCETHIGPRTPGDPVQDFDTEMVQLQGAIFGDPDFDQLTIVAGSANGLPSPGHTTLTDLGDGTFNVDSFFDIAYTIDFVGAPGSVLDGMSGSTTGTLRMQAGEPPPPPPTWLATTPLPRGESHIEFGNGTAVPPVPADFFDPGSEPFVGVVRLQGNPIDPATMGNTDTVVQRLTDTLPAGIGDTATVEVEIVALSLVSAEPIQVTYGGTGSPELWDLMITLGPGTTDPNANRGTMTILRTHANGGTFDSFFDVEYRVDFVRQSDSALRTLVPPAPIPLGHELGHWVGSLDPSLGVLAPAGTTYFPGVSEDPTTGAQSTEPFDPTSGDQPPSVIHIVEPPKYVCTYEITCAEGDCSGCPAAAFGFCEGDPCTDPIGGTCAVMNGLTSTCGATGCCIEFGLFTCGPPTGAPPCPPVDTCVCAPLGACCLDDGTCSETTEADCGGTWHDGIACGAFGACCFADGTCGMAYEACCDGTFVGGQCQTPQACCLGGTCQTLDPRCCQALGGIVQPAGETCSTATEACCVPDPIGGVACVDIDPACCDDRGGTSQGPGSTCLGDSDGNLIDDACEPDVLCPLPSNNQLCAPLQDTDCISTGGANELCIPLLVRRNAANQIEAVQCNCIENALCGPIEATQIVGTNEYTLSCQNACPNPAELCLVHIDNVSTGQGSIDSSIVNAGETVTCQCGGPAACEPNATGTACEPFDCPDDGTGIAQACQPQCVEYDPLTGATIVTDCACEPDSDCHVKFPAPGAVASGSDPCVVVDTGGTVSLPPVGCPYLSPDDVHKIIDGLPAGTTIEFDATHEKFLVRSQTPGGNLGGEIEIFDSFLVLNVQGTGALGGFSRSMALPVGCEVHSGPRTPGDAVQDFDTEMVQLQGQLFGDPDFCLLRVTGGSNNGLPSPGHTTLTQLPSGNFNVDSFFDIEYRIDFQGCPGSPLDGLSGSTTGTIRMSTGAGPTCEGACPPGEVCNEIRTVNADGTIKLCCECVPEPQVCQPNSTSTDCEPVTCPDPNQVCEPRVITLFGTCSGTVPPLTCTSDADCPNATCVKVSRVIDCDCIGDTDCHVEFDPANNVPVCVGTCPPGMNCELFSDDADGDGVRDTFWCDCVDPPACKPNTAGTACEPFVCPDDPFGIVQECQPQCATYDPLTGATVVTACDCTTLGDCHVELPAPGAIAGGSDPCVVADTGGTVSLPPAGCPYLSPDDVHKIIDGLPAGTTIEFDASHDKFITRSQTPGGNLGGEIEIFDSFLFMNVSGTGALGGFSRFLSVPVGCEAHTGPRTPGDPVQSFDTEMVQLQGELFGDPDFCVFRIVGGSNNGLPSPGHTTLTRLPSGNFNVDSFFDIAYTIEFQGCPGSPLDGLAGTTTGTIRMATGAGPTCKGNCPPGTVCSETRTVNADGSITLCCDCVPDVQDCGPDATGTACLPVTCPDPTQICQPAIVSIIGTCADNGAPCQSDADCSGIVCVRTSTIDVCECTDQCHVEIDPATLVPFCVGTCPPGQDCALFGEDLDGDGNRDRFWCDCVEPPACKPNATQTACDPFACPVDATGVEGKCSPKCMHFDPTTGVTTVTECDCAGPNECHAESVNVAGNVAAALDPACVVVDNGTGTVTLPPAGCPYLSPDDVHEIIAGLPAGTTIELDASHEKFIVQSNVPGGTLGGEIEQFSSFLRLNVNGTGALAGLSRTMFVPVQCEAHTGPRTPGDPVQSFDSDMFRLQGELFGDPDFCTLRITGGTDNGMPSPGHTTLTRLPTGNFNVDSFFDIAYDIEFQGCPGSALDGMGGTTTGTIRMATGAGPSCVGACPPGTECVEQRTVNADGTIDLCCSCECPVIDPPAPAPVPVDKNRFISFSPTNPGRLTALRVTLINLPGAYSAWNGHQMWVNGPRQVTELPSSDAPLPLPAFSTGTLSCNRQCRDWTDVRVLNVYHEAVIPGARYEVVAVDCECDTAPSESAPLGLTTAKHGDVVGPFNAVLGMWTPPDGSVDVATDVVSILDKFGAAATAPSKTWTDLEPACLDLKINITDAVIVLDAFSGASYPFAPSSTDPCATTCP